MCTRFRENQRKKSDDTHLPRQRLINYRHYKLHWLQASSAANHANHSCLIAVTRPSDRYLTSTSAAFCRHTWSFINFLIIIIIIIISQSTTSCSISSSVRARCKWRSLADCEITRTKDAVTPAYDLRPANVGYFTYHYNDSPSQWTMNYELWTLT